jgi:hypothetical protein
MTIFSEFGGTVRLLLLGALSLSATLAEARADRPGGWGGGGEGYELSADRTVKHEGQASGSVKATDQDLAANGFGTLTQAIRADKYRGKRLRMSAYVKTADVDGWSGLWMRVDGAKKTALAFDNMMDRSIKGTTDWAKYEVVLDIPEEAEGIYFGFLVAGKGQGWVDDIHLEVVGDDVKATALPVEPQDPEGDLPKGLPDEPKNLDFEG